MAKAILLADIDATVPDIEDVVSSANHAIVGNGRLLRPEFSVRELTNAVNIEPKNYGHIQE